MKNLCRSLTALFFCGVCVAPNVLLGLDCICTKYPMYPYSGDFWMHYAVQTYGTCQQGNPCPHIQTYTADPKDCMPASCGDCTALGQTRTADVGTVAGANLHLRTANMVYADVDESREIKDILKNHTLLEGVYLRDAQDYLEGMEFTTVDGAARPRALKLSREVGGRPQVFYAVVWKMKRPQVAGEGGYLGIEITDVPPGDPLLPDADTTFRALVIAENGSLLQPIVVRGAIEVKSSGRLYLVRLLNTVNNTARDAFPIRYTR